MSFAERYVPGRSSLVHPKAPEALLRVRLQPRASIAFSWPGARGVASWRRSCARDMASNVLPLPLTCR